MGPGNAVEQATNRFQLIAPLLEEALDKQERAALLHQLSQRHGVSERTIRRYLAQFHKEGFEGLKPKAYRPVSVENQDPVLEQAILLRREVPSRSIASIIQILEWDGLVEKGTVKRSTLQEQLAKRGYSARQMKLYHETSGAVRRFQKRSRNALWHSDIKYGPYLPIGPNGTKKQVYMVAFLDDATRYPLHVSFYPMLDARCVEEAFRESVRTYGIPEQVYFDNGKQYRTKWMAKTCAKLGTRLLYAKPYSPESTGKIERFNRTFDAFLQEVQLERPKTVEALNQWLRVWLDERYIHQPHQALGTTTTPFQAYRQESTPIRTISAEELAQAFLHTETRKVDKSGCISFQDTKYEVGITLLGCRVEITYDPQDTTTLTIDYPGYDSWTATKLTMTEQTGKRPSLPVHMTKEPAGSSRLLQGAKKQNEERRAQAKGPTVPAVHFRHIAKGGPSHV
ncbi:DDE-type integrase/transposase/recombinase [Alkalicoccus luteus]|uniref:Transposase n=1 Tax=Alkalicoccus luteus TaxID=1237094 RepID=A0A969TVQ4_9BACI|nr:transposase [Alkalicoccus luteus]